MRQRLLLLAAAGALSACGAAAEQSAPPPPSLASAAQAPSNPGGQTPGRLLGHPPTGQAAGPLPIDLSQPLKTQATCGDWPRSGPPTLQQSLSEVAPDSARFRTAAIVTVLSSAGAPIYNTPDGARWTQAWLNARHTPDIYTPYAFTVQRPLAPGLTAGQRITGYVEGGTMPNGDEMKSCTGQPSVAGPAAGSQAVVIFGGSVPDLSIGPTVTLFDVVEGSSVVTYRGREPIP
jgi:hypothetical protein